MAIFLLHNFRMSIPAVRRNYLKLYGHFWRQKICTLTWNSVLFSAQIFAHENVKSSANVYCNLWTASFLLFLRKYPAFLGVLFWMHSKLRKIALNQQTYMVQILVLIYHHEQKSDRGIFPTSWYIECNEGRLFVMVIRRVKFLSADLVPST